MGWDKYFHKADHLRISEVLGAVGGERHRGLQGGHQTEIDEIDIGGLILTRLTSTRSILAD